MDTSVRLYNFRLCAPIIQSIMKRYLLAIALFLPFNIFASNFSDLNNLCISKTEGQYSSNADKLILKHINGRITKTEGFVKYDDYIYMVANIFTDNYRFLGSYLLEYDCKEGSTKRLSSLLKRSWVGMGFIQYSDKANSIWIRQTGNSDRRWVWVYDLENNELKWINSKPITIPNWYKASWVEDLDTYNGKSIELTVRYYTGNYKYINFSDPEIVTYSF